MSTYPIQSTPPAPGTMATFGSPGAPAPSAYDFSTSRADVLRAQQKQQLAQLLLKSGYVRNSGALGALAQIIGAWKAGKLNREAGETISDALRREFAERERTAAEQAAAASQADEARAKRDHLYRIDEIYHRNRTDNQPASWREYDASRRDPGFADFLDKRTRASGPRPTEGANQDAIMASRKQALE